jgi:hypothetical protein
MGLLGWIRFLWNPPGYVRSDETGIWVVESCGHTETVRWSELRLIFVQRDAEAGITYWRLVGTGGSGCMIPDRARGAAAVVGQLRQLTGFDEPAARRGFDSTDTGQLFECWRAPAEPVAAADPARLSAPGTTANTGGPGS